MAPALLGFLLPSFCFSLTKLPTGLGSPLFHLCMCPVTFALMPIPLPSCSLGVGCAYSNWLCIPTYDASFRLHVHPSALPCEPKDGCGASCLASPSCCFPVVSGCVGVGCAHANPQNSALSALACAVHLVSPWLRRSFALDHCWCFPTQKSSVSSLTCLQSNRGPCLPHCPPLMLSCTTKQSIPHALSACATHQWHLLSCGPTSCADRPRLFPTVGIPGSG